MDKKIPYEKILEYTNREKAMQAMDFAIDQVKTFKPIDFLIFHSVLISFGVLIGTTLVNYLKKYRIFIVFGFFISCIYLIVRIFQNLDD